MELSVMDRINMILNDPEKALMTLAQIVSEEIREFKRVAPVSYHAGSRSILQKQVFRPDEDGRRFQPFERKDRTTDPEKAGSTRRQTTFCRSPGLWTRKAKHTAKP